MKNAKQAVSCLFIMLAVLFAMFGFSSVTGEAAEYSASVSTDRPEGRCTYTVQGLDTSQTGNFTLQVSRADTEEMMLEQNITLTEENCLDGIYQGEFSLSDVNNICTDYLVELVIQDEKIAVGNCDFSIHADEAKMSIKGSSSQAIRTVKLNFTEPSEGVLAPGEGNRIAVMVWQKDKEEETAQTAAEISSVSGGSVSCSIDVTEAGNAYGTWYARAVLRNEHWSGDIPIAEVKYSIAPTQTGLTTKKTKALEEKKSFAVDLKGLKNAYGIKKVTFQIYDSKGKKAASIAGQKKNESNSRYYAEVSLKKLNYQLEQYTVKAVITDLNGKTRTLSAEASVDERPQEGILSVTKKGNASCSYQLGNAYIPGNIKKVEFVLYQIQDGEEKKLDTYSAKANASKKKFSVSVKHGQTGNYKVKAYGFTAWDEKLLLNQQTYQLKEKDMGKNGWYYEKYNGETYKFYYINNRKQTDLTKILNLSESSAGNGSNLYIELNRAACTVTIYLYNEETGKYDIPVKSCAVSVGRDTYTTAGTGSLNTNSSYTPLGDYSICTNGTSVKYTLKPMYEPDGSTVYARWCTHIVGNVYFHAIAVGSDTHYGLSSYTYNKLGSPASAGCVRMTVADAKWIYDYAKTGTKVKIVKGNSSKPGPLGKPDTIKTTDSIHYDPTDPDVPDSRKKADYKAGRISGYMTKDGEKVGY